MKDMTREFRNRAKLHFKPAPDYYHMSLHNEGLFEITNAVIDELIKCSGVVKYHFPPTENNQDRLRSFKKVVLLRNPEDVVRAWMRGDETRAYKLRSPEFAFTFSEEAWLKKAHDLGLVEELHSFANGWRNHDGQALIIEMNDLINDTSRVISSIERYLDLPASDASQLPRRKFSRGRNAERSLWNTRLRQFIRRRNVMLKRIIM